MRIFAISDVHVDFPVNAKWIDDLSRHDFQEDMLILAGDVSDDLRLVHQCLSSLSKRFRKVFFVPGNHDLWVARFDSALTSLDKFEHVLRVADESGVSTRRHDEPGFSIVPLLSWYDYSFGEPSDALRAAWMDFVACRWPDGMDVREVTTHFLARNSGCVSRGQQRGMVITFSHFLPRGDLLPARMLPNGIDLHPVLGTDRLDAQVRALEASIHVYGHSHVNRDLSIDGVTYINNALGYPRETGFTSKMLRCVYEETGR